MTPGIEFKTRIKFNFKQLLSGFKHTFKITEVRKMNVKVNSRNKSTQVRLDEEGKDIRIKQINTGIQVDNRDKRAQVGLIEEGKDMKIEQIETSVKRNSRDKRENPHL